MASKADSKRQKAPQESRSEARESGLLIRMSRLERRLLHQAASQRGTTVQALVLAALAPIMHEQLQQLTLEMDLVGLEAETAVNTT